MDLLKLDKNRKLDLILLGRVAVDLNPTDYFKPLSENKEFRKYLGGSPANIAVGLARLGGAAGFVGKISDDGMGDFVRDFFVREGIDVSHVTRASGGESLGLTFTEILSPDESNILMYRTGVADLALSPADVDEAYIASAKMLLISGTALCQSPSREAALKAVALAKKTDTKIIFDIDYRAYNWKNADEIAVYYSAVAEKSDIIMGSREEFDLTEAFLGSNRTDKETADYWLNKGNKIVIIKHGKQGSTAHTARGDYGIKPFPVKAFKSFGGGDGYGSAFIYGLLKGLPVIDCLELASASASMLVSAHGCSEFMPTVKELKNFIKAEKKLYGEMIARV
ncbi:MAG: 5-dehydro-2-deoxygluconokinase [Clostridiaceae bacterium]|jgi:5-dehydro-2-deoxygluconokinase|nr:5-dehydro-2-deoxygluconokinase [Clostridiaceae bacterium]